MTLLNASVHPLTKPGTARVLQVGTFRRVLQLAQQERERRRQAKPLPAAARATEKAR